MTLPRYRVGHVERMATVAIGVALALLINCGGDDDSEATGPSRSDGGPSGTSSGGSSSGSSSGSFGDGGATAPARGVLLMHTAAFPSMRLCFSEYLDIPPQPDRKVLPQANVVGVELGGVVRLGPMEHAPGMVMVIPQSKVEAAPGQTELTCRKYLAAHNLENADFWKAGEIKAPVGKDKAEVLAITGCGPSNLLSTLKIPAADWPTYCGKDYTGDKTASGTMAAKVFALTSTQTTTDRSMPMSLVNMSPLIGDLTPVGQKIDVTFGEFSDAGATGPLTTEIPLADALYTEGATTTLNLVQSEPVFGQYGFRVAYRDSDGGVPDGGAVFDQTLATIQATSRADGNPTTYYIAQSNFTFFLLGDPRMKPTVDGGANPNFDDRRAVHLLAVPVFDETEILPLGGDAGATDTGPTDAGDAGAQK